MILRFLNVLKFIVGFQCGCLLAGRVSKGDPDKFQHFSHFSICFFLDLLRRPRKKKVSTRSFSKGYLNNIFEPNQVSFRLY